MSSLASVWHRISRSSKDIHANEDRKPLKGANTIAIREGAIWESLITLNSDVEPEFELLPCASEYPEAQQERRLSEIDEALRRDVFPLPATKDREGYHGQNHFRYWLSGHTDAQNLRAATEAYGTPLRAYLDLGCASGRVLRHMALQLPECRAVGCDINRLHVEWCNGHLPGSCVVFQNHSVPSLPLPDNEFDLVSAFSVFTHIEALETAWLMELRRILRPGGVAWVTVHSEHILREMNENWPLWKPTYNHPIGKRLLESDREFEGNRVVLRWRMDRSYSSNVFYKLDYLKSHWGRILEIVEIKRRFPGFQDVLIMRKPL